MSQEGIERLRRIMAEHGIHERHHDGPVELAGSTRPAGHLGADTRGSNTRCAICIGPLNPRKKVRVAENQYAHPFCASAPQVGEWVLRHWLATPLEVRRRRGRIQQHYGRDPFTCEEMPTEVEWIEAPLDVDGVPMSVEVERSTQRRLITFGVPNCWWQRCDDEGLLSRRRYPPE